MAQLIIENADRRESVPLWLVETNLPVTPVLDADVRADVCIIGAGMAGLSTAYELALRGIRVVVVEQADIGSGETGRSTAHLTTALDERYSTLQRLHGADGARLAAESHANAIDRISHIVMAENIECGFQRVDGYLMAERGDTDELYRELAAARLAGLSEVELVDRALIEPSEKSPALRFPEQAQMDPARYLGAVARGSLARGGSIFTRTRAMTVEGGRDARVQTAEGPIVTAGAVVVATNAPFNNLVALHAKQVAYRTYVVAARVPKGSVAPALYWDTDHPFHYVRLDVRDPEADLVIVGGEDHKTGHEVELDERWRRLDAWLRARFPNAARASSRWSGQVMHSHDGLAYIGRNLHDDDNVLVATGDSGNGLTHGAIAGVLLAATIQGEEHPFVRLYDPSRVTLRAGVELLRQNLDAVQQYAHWVEAGDVADEEQIPPGQGAVVRDGVRLLAVYRDLRGNFHRCSAVCPHLGGIVQFNMAEASWDCPCHGSRFDAVGHVIRGPANVDLLRHRESLAEPVSEQESMPEPLFGALPST